MRRWILLAMLLLYGGCRFDSPGYDGTGYACSAENPSCPPGQECIDGRCTGGGGDDELDVDAGHVDEAPPDGAVGGTATARLVPTDDTTLRLEDPTTPDGTLEYLEIDASPEKVSLMLFDLSEIPPGAEVLDAHLEAEVFDPIETGTFQIYAVTEPWNETDASWIEREAGNIWLTPGVGDLSSDRGRLVAELAADTIGPIAMPFDLDTVQAWVDSPGDNHGFVLISTSPDGFGGQLRSRDYSVEGERPILHVHYRE